jgi:ferredoxin--NADP+ reductase
LFKILEKADLADKICKYVFEAPQLSRKAKPGQFVMIRIDDNGERIPLTLAGKDPEKGTITIVVQSIGTTTTRLHEKNQGDSIADIIGPLGTPNHFEEHWKKAICIGGGVGIAEILPTAKGCKEHGIEVIGIIGSRNKDLLFFEKEMKDVCDSLIVTSDDGSYGRKGLVLDPLKEMMERGDKIDVVFCVGPVIMMREVSKATKPYGIKTIVSLNPIMVDGTGMCGACRLTVGGKTKFGCVEGPDFDGHEVDFDELMSRLSMFKKLEQDSLALWQSKGGH